MKPTHVSLNNMVQLFPPKSFPLPQLTGMCRRSTSTRRTTLCQTWRPSWTRSSATPSGTCTTPAEQRWDIFLFKCQHVVRSVPIFPSVIFPTVILSPSWGRAEAELRDLKAWPVSYRWRSCACVYIVRTKGKLTKIINGPVWKLYNFSRAEVCTNMFLNGLLAKKVHATFDGSVQCPNNHNNHSKVVFDYLAVMIWY